MTCQQLLWQVREWNVEYRLKEKYHSWKLKYALPKVPQAFFRLAETSLITYVLENLGWLVHAKEEQIKTYLSAMKTAYAQMNMGSSISSEIFNFWMVLLVKLAAYFLSNHVTTVLVDISLECDIYRYTMFNVLGIHIQKNTYRILLRMFVSRKAASKERQSIKLERQDDQKENDIKDPKIRTIQSIGRRNGKHQTTFFSNLASFNEERARLEQMKYLLKSNLYVKPIPRKVQQKITIGDLKRQNHSQGSSLQAQARITPTGKFTIQANQLSHAFSANYDLRLNEIKNHSIHCSHTKNISRAMPSKPKKKLQIKRQEDHQQDRKGVKPTKNWIKIVTQMKEDLYQHKGSRISQDLALEQKRQEREYFIQQRTIEISKKQKNSKERWQPNQQAFRFRKLNLMNSPNIIVYDDCPIDLNEQQPTSATKPSIKVNRSRLQRIDRNKNSK